MKNTINTFPGQEQTPEQEQKIQAISTKVSQELADLFGLNEEKLNKLQQEESIALNNEIKEETTKLSDEMDVNWVEYQLATMFGKEKELLALNKPMSINSVMQELEEYSLQVA